MSLLNRAPPAALCVLWVPTCDHRPGFVRDADIQLKAPCYQWLLPWWGCGCAGCACPHWHISAAWLLLQMVSPDRPGRGGPPSFGWCGSVSSLLFFHHCVENKGRHLMKQELRRRKSWSLGANFYAGFAVPWCSLLHHQSATAPLESTWAV